MGAPMDGKATIDPPIPGVPGVKDEVAWKVAGMLHRGTRYFGSSGASLSHHANNPDYKSEFKQKVVELGLEGERSTTLLLKRWMAKHPNAVLLDSVHIRGMGKEEIDEETGMVEGGDTDHVLLLGNQAILIDTKRWKRNWRYSINEKGQVLRGRMGFAGGRRLHAKAAKHLWRGYLHPSAQVSSVVCINAPGVTVTRNRNWYRQSYRLVEADLLFAHLDEMCEKMPPEDLTHINSTLVAQIAVCCIKPFDPYTRVFDMDALKRFR